MATELAFTAIVVVGFPDEWPPPAVQMLMQWPVDSNSKLLNWRAYPDGHIELQLVEASGALAAQRHFARLVLTGGPQVIVTAMYGGPAGLRLWLNGAEVETLAQSSDAVAIGPSPTVRSERSIGHPRSALICVKRVEQRTQRFENRSQSNFRRQGRRARTTAEEVRDLHDAAQRLRSNLASLFAGELYMAAAVASELRSLLYWPTDKATWNPLLFRVANRYGLGLPVFALPTDREGRPEAPLPEMSLDINGPSIMLQYETQQLYDLADYLDQPAVTFEAADNKRTLSIMETIAYTANTSGSSHYDDTVILDIDRIQAIILMRATALDRLLIKVAEAVVQLIDYVVGAAA